MSASLAQWLALAQLRGVPRLDAQRLAAHQLGRTREWVIAHDDARLGARDAAALDALLLRRAAGTPLAYLVGRREFHGLDLVVSADVLVPRPETELLVDWALERLAPMRAADPTQVPDVVDLGTGSGAVALAVAHAAPWVHMTATDASAAALDVAGRNAMRLALPLECVAGNWWQPLAGRCFALALANPPYVAHADPHLQTLAHEPLQALAAGPDGLDALRCIVAGAPAHLAPAAWLLLEHGFDQGDAVRRLLGAAGFQSIETRHDLAGVPRCTGGRWPG
ncbi:MAG TPA: peptide chain release factor N(5)-glutamine methyltransferase [Rubrivivax sp.]|jgi:release factor glutamine methyltransferase|nr:peptide chain release factor N(5)-glutamine methyltransferase [Pseudomonadota bacterium]HPP83147.1 peptide chain release factor N(5)-glutamine methyltransferase [Rubrivivax sp.]